MKKYILSILLILLFIPLALFIYNKCSGSVYETLDFSGEDSDFQANKILYEYILKEQNKTPKEIEVFANITPKSTKAFQVDLNDDGTNEIVGLVYSTLYWGTAGASLFILQKQPDGYKNISYVLNFEPKESVYIFEAKTNGYKDIKFYGSFGYNGKPFIAKYKDRYYQNDYQTKSLEQGLRQ